MLRKKSSLSRVICTTFILLSPYCHFVTGQIDTNFIKEIPVNKTLQIHTTVKIFSIKLLANQQESLVFQNSNLSAGLYVKRNIFEFFFSIPIITFNNFSNSNQKAYGTGFGLHYFEGKYHVNYNFKYIQGYKDLKTVLDDKLKTIENYNHVFYNQMQAHYVWNSDQFSLQSALRFRNRQLKSAGSFLVSVPVTYHFGEIKTFDQSAVIQLENLNFYRISIGTAIGYGYTHVVGKWAASIVPKIGLEMRISDLNASEIAEQYSLNIFPNFSLSSSAAYYHKNYFGGIVFNYFPEVSANQDFELNIVNWQVRLYIGKTF